MLASRALCTLLFLPVVASAPVAAGRQAPMPPMSGRAMAVPRPPRASAETLARLRSYHDHLGTILGDLPARASLAQVLPPMMAFAASRASDASRAEEVRASLFVLSFYVNEWGLDRVVPEASGWPPLPKRSVLLRERDDLTKHFTLSAFIAAEAGGPVAVLAGVYKEVRDSRGGSGFSFVDLAADRAGTRFGERATKDPDAGRTLLAAAGNLAEEDFMPAIAELPEGLPEAEFQTRFGGIGAPKYNEMVAEIDRRLDALRVFRSAP